MPSGSGSGLTSLGLHRLPPPSDRGTRAANTVAEGAKSHHPAGNCLAERTVDANQTGTWTGLLTSENERFVI